MDDVHRTLGYVPMSAELMADSRGMMDRLLDRMFRPWKFADPNPMPYFDWWPQATRLAEFVTGRERRSA